MATCRFCKGSAIATGGYTREDPNIKVIRCTACGLTQLSDFTHIEEQFYENELTLPPNISEERKRQRKWNKTRLDYIFLNIPEAKNLNVLDFGCGTGGFLEIAQDKFKAISGFELSKEVCNSHIQQGWSCYSEFDDIPDEFEICTLFHVLEHIKEPWVFLDELWEKMTKTKFFVIEVPNTDEALNSVFNSVSYQRTHYGIQHLWYFTSSTLKKVVSKANLEIIFESQQQRYSLANTFGWLANEKGGGQNMWPFFNDEDLNKEYERVLIENKIADSVFIICKR